MCLLLGVSVQNNYKNNNSNKSNNNTNNNEVAEGARETKSSVKTKFWLKFSPCFGSQLEPRASCMPRPFSLMPKPASDPPAASSWEILFSSPLPTGASCGFQAHLVHSRAGIASRIGKREQIQVVFVLGAMLI